jgi:hypothetical protein
MLLHGFNIKRSGNKTHQYKGKTIRRPDKPFFTGNIKICVKKVDIDREKINYKKMIYATYDKSQFR